MWCLFFEVGAHRVRDSIGCVCVSFRRVIRASMRVAREKSVVCYNSNNNDDPSSSYPSQTWW
jgi:hypothetical protein